jgi:hypothetical protein
MKTSLTILVVILLLSCERKENTCLSTLIIEGKLKFFRTSFMPNKYFWLISNTMVQIKEDTLFALGYSDRAKLHIGNLYKKNNKWSAYTLRKNLDYDKTGLVIFDNRSIIGLAFLE